MLPLNVPALLRRYNLHPNKRLGQNFLTAEAALAKVAAAADLSSTDTVLEIGAGLGSLTRHLAAAAGRVVAVEVDPTLLPVLEHVLCQYSNVEIVPADILRLDPARLVGSGTTYKVAANIPYYISSAIIQHLLEAERRPELMVLTLQREVAERICAVPDEMSLLAVSVQFYGAPRIVARLPAGAFYPPPAVESAVVRVEVFDRPPVAVTDRRRFFRLVKAGFSQKRKQLHNALGAALHLDRPRTEALLAAAGLEPARRAETLSLEEWAALERAAAAMNILEG